MTRVADYVSSAVIFAAAALGVSDGADSQPKVDPASPAPSPVQAPKPLAAESNNTDVRQSLREIRDDVRALRQDVEKLRELLKSTSAKGDSNGPKKLSGQGKSDDCAEVVQSDLTNGVYFFYSKSCGP